MDPLDLIRQGKVKRFFRATRKITAPKVISHLTQRAAGSEPLFIEEDDYLFMLANVKDVAGKRGLAVYAFCLMPNHIHLLLRPEVDNLNDAMRDLCARYASRFNKKYERKGHLFGSPYRQAVCLDEGYLLAASLYIHNNPVKAGLAASATAYRWSSAALYCKERPPKSFVSQKFILDMLHGAETGTAAYRKLLEASEGIEEGRALEQQDALERFRGHLAKMFPKLFESFRPMRKVVDLDLLDPEELDKRIEEEKQSRGTRRPRTTEATRYLVKQLLARGYKRIEIAQRLGISRKTVYNLTRKESNRFAGHA
jgi:putative transposase